MFNLNSGYVGASRSVRSEEAIASYEVPLSMINRSLIEDYLDENKDDFTKDELDFLSKVALQKWKFIAKTRILASSWHHTSSYFNETKHYRLATIAEKLLELKDTLDEEFQEHQKKEETPVKFGVIKVQIWGGTRDRRKLVGYDEVAGIVVGNWLFYKINHSVNGSISKYKINANKVECFKEYDSYAYLAENNNRYKGTKKVFNKLISEKGLKK